MPFAWCNVSRSLSKHVEDGLLWYPLQLGPFAEGVCSERCSEAALQRIDIGEEPSLHDLHHEKCLSIIGPRGSHPPVTDVQVFPNVGPHGAFTVHQEERSFFHGVASRAISECVEGVLSSTASS